MNINLTEVKVSCECNSDKCEHEKKEKTRKTSSGFSEKFKRFSYEEVKGAFKENGCQLLSKKYNGAKEELEYICKCGNRHSKLFYQFVKSSMCPDCATKIRAKEREFSYEEVNKFFVDNGCELISKEYDGYKSSLLKFKCKCGEICEKNFSAFQRSPKCRICINKTTGREKCSYEDVCETFNNNGYKLLSTWYNGDRDTDLKFLCEFSHENYASYDRIVKKNYNCEQCKNALRFKEANELVEGYGCKIIDFVDINFRSDKEKLKIKCKCNKIYHTRFCNFKSSKYKSCKECSFKIANSKYHTEEHLREKEQKETFRTRCRKMVKRVLSVYSLKKMNRTNSILGYSHNDLIKHITAHKNWNNVKDKPWHLDHIFPVIAFYSYGIKDLKLINCLDNLQPLSQLENTSKNDKYSKKEFEAWLISKGVIFESKQ